MPGRGVPGGVVSSRCCLVVGVVVVVVSVVVGGVGVGVLEQKPVAHVPHIVGHPNHIVVYDLKQLLESLDLALELMVFGARGLSHHRVLEEF